MTDLVPAQPNLTAPIAAPVTPNTPAPAPAAPAEKMLSQSEVNELIGRNKTESYEKGKRDGLQSLQMQQQQAQPPTANQPPQTVGGMQQQTPDQIDKMIDDRVNARMAHKDQELAVRNFSNQFEQKVVQGQQKYGTEFDQVLRDINLPQLAQTNPAFIYMLGGVDNTADVLKDLHARPQQLATIINLAANPATQSLAQSQMNTLAQSIKQNEQATKQPNAAEPLSQIKPSPTGADNGAMGVRDLKKVDWLRA